MSENRALKALDTFHQPTAAAHLDKVFASPAGLKPLAQFGAVAKVAALIRDVQPVLASSQVPNFAATLGTSAPVAARLLKARDRAALNRQSALDLYSGRTSVVVDPGIPRFQRSPAYLEGRSASPVLTHAISQVGPFPPRRKSFDRSHTMPGSPDWQASLGSVSGRAAPRWFRPFQEMIAQQVQPVISSAIKTLNAADSPIAKFVRSETPLVIAFVGADERHHAAKMIIGNTETAASALSKSLADVVPLTASRLMSAQSSGANPALEYIVGSSAASVIPDYGAAVRFRHSPAHPSSRPMSPALASLIEGMTPSPALAPTYEAPTWPEVIEPEVLEVIEVDELEVGPQEFAESSARLEVRENRIAAEAVLIRTGLDGEELEHLRGIPELLMKGGHRRVHAAQSASLVLEHLADRINPASPGGCRDRINKHYTLGGAAPANRLIVFVDQQLVELSSKEYAEFVATMNLVKEWTGKGHHVPHSQEFAEYAYRQFLRVVAFVARAHRA